MKKRNNQAKQVLAGLKHDMQQFMETEDYAAAMDVMAEMAANKQMDGEIKKFMAAYQNRMMSLFSGFMEK